MFVFSSATETPLSPSFSGSFLDLKDLNVDCQGVSLLKGFHFIHYETENNISYKFECVTSGKYYIVLIFLNNENITLV